MFKKLHLKLTLYNTVILIVFMVIFLMVVLFFMNKVILSRANYGYKMQLLR